MTYNPHTGRCSGVNHTTQLDRIEAMLVQLTAKKKPKARAAKKNEYSSNFEAIWKDYPKVSGANKMKAYAAYLARMEEAGLSWSRLIVIMHMAVKAYAKLCKATDRRVMLPATFFGPDKHYNCDWTLPKVKPEADPNKQLHPTYDPNAPAFEPTTAFVEPHPLRETE